MKQRDMTDRGMPDRDDPDLADFAESDDAMALDLEDDSYVDEAVAGAYREPKAPRRRGLSWQDRPPLRG